MLSSRVGWVDLDTLKRLMGVIGLVVLGCTGLICLDASFQMDTSAKAPAGTQLIAPTDVPPPVFAGPDEVFPKWVHPGGGPHEGRFRPFLEGEEPEPFDEALFLKWRGELLAGLAAEDAACGSRTRPLCDDRACVMVLRRSAGDRLKDLARRPGQIAEQAAVHFLGLPEEFDQCGQSQKRGEAVKSRLLMGLTDFSREGWCIGVAPEADRDYPGQFTHADALCDRLMAQE